MLPEHISSFTFKSISPIMYHGTNSGNHLSLLQGINVNHSNRNTDFGDGFYLTSNFDQASEQAIRKSRIRKDKPIVFIYELDVDRLQEKFNSKIFCYASERRDRRNILLRKYCEISL